MKTILGFVFGSLMTYLSLEYAYSPPVVFQVPNKIQALTENVIASSFVENTEATKEQRQRAVATLIKNDPSYYIEIDNAIDNKFTSEAIDKVAQRKLAIIRNYDQALKIAFEGEKNLAIRKYYENKYETKDLEIIKENLMIEEIRKDLLVYKNLKKRYPGISDEKIVREIFK